jgi:signal peptidase II
MTNSSTRSYRWLFWLVALVGLTADQCSKYGVFAYLYNPGRDEESIAVIPGAFNIEARYTKDKETGTSLFSSLRTVSADHLPMVNKGALWGTTLNLSPETANGVFTIVSIVAALGIVFWSTRPGAGRDRILCCALGLVLAGTLGNLYDRIIFSGVRDFLHWKYLIVMNDFPVFNVADSCLVCGAALLLLQAFFSQPSEATVPQATVAVGAGETASK